MPHSLKSKIKSLCYKGEITEQERDRIIHALEQQLKMQDCEHCIHTYGTLGCCDMVNNEWIYDCEFGKEQYKKEHEQQPCEKDVLKFYYVESLDDYWIGERLDTMYYAEWDFELQGFVWTHSKYLPWGEHVVAPNTLWKEHTYPSEPKEIPFEKWIKGFLKKHGREQQPSEDCISRNELLARIDAERKHLLDLKMDGAEHVIVHHARRIIEDMPSITPKALEQQPCEDCISREDAKNLFWDGTEGYDCRGFTRMEIGEMLDDLPSVQPQQKIGHWIDIMVADMPAQACDQCKTFYPLSYTGGGHNYCPSCGSRMVEPQESEDKG